MEYNPNAPPLNAGTEWSEMAIFDLRAAHKAGDSIKEIAVFIQRTEDEVREKLLELGLL